MSLLRDEGPQLRTRSKKVLSVKEQKADEERKKARRKRRQWQDRIKKVRATTSRAEAAIRLVIAALPLVLIGGALGKAATLPTTWEATQTATLDANVPAVFNAVENLGSWPLWAKVVDVAGKSPEYPVGKVGDSAVMEVHEDGQTTLRLLIDTWKIEQEIGYHTWVDNAEVPVSGVVTFTPKGTKTVVTWTEGGASPEGPLGTLERFKHDRRAAEAKANIAATLKALSKMLKGKQQPSRLVQDDDKRPATGDEKPGESAK